MLDTYGIHLDMTDHSQEQQRLKQIVECSLLGKCGWCSYKVQTREHLVKNCPCWKPQQKILRVEVR
jgi:hypothetical protein